MPGEPLFGAIILYEQNIPQEENGKIHKKQEVF
jgi:hypothetical protein